jgi:CHAT domain-containing protein/tetratricopeptide (TPR) repeat protein
VNDRSLTIIGAAVATVALSAILESRLASQGSSGDANALLVAGQYERAEVLARARFDALRAEGDEDTLPVAHAADVLVRALILNGRAADSGTRALAESVVRTKERLLGTEHGDLVRSLLNLADALVGAAKLDEAIGTNRRAVALCERRCADKAADLPLALDQLGASLAAAGQHDAALTVLERSLHLKEQTLSPGDTAIARTLEELGYVLQRKGMYERAGTLLRRADALQVEADRGHPARVRTLKLLGDQFWFEGQLLASRDTLEQAVALAHRTLRPDHPTLALCLRVLAATLADVGDISRALELKTEALAIVERNFGPRHQMTAEYLHSLGLAELDSGQYSAARRHFQQALPLYEARYGPSHEFVATALSVLALADARLGDYDTARREQSRAVAIYTRVGGPNHPFVAIALTELATVYLEEGQPLRALPYLERALAIRERNLGTAHRDVARTLVDLASALMDTGSRTRAQTLAARAVRIWESQDAPDAPEFATVLALYAELQANRGDNTAARDYYQRAMAIRARSLGPANPLFAEAESGFALTLARIGDRQTALTTALKAEATGRDHLRLMLRSLPERQALNYAASRPQALNLILSLSHTMPDAAPLAFDTFIRSRALVLDEIAARQGSGETDPARTALVSAQQRLANLTVRGPGQLSLERYTALLDDTRRESERAEQALAEQSVEFRAERSRAQVGLAEVESALPADTVLLSFARYQRTVFPNGASPTAPAASTRAAPPAIPSYAAFVLRSSQQPVVVPLGTAQTIEALVSQWRADIAADVIGAPATGEAQAAPSSRVSGAALRKVIWDPIAIHFSDAARVVIVPDGALSLVPFAALPTGRRSFVIESGPVIHYLSAERDVTLPSRPPDVKGGLLAMGGPAFDRSVVTRPTGSHGTTGTSSGVALRGLGQPCLDLQSLKFQPLLGTAREVREVSALWRNVEDSTDPDAARVLVGTAATETTFKSAAPKQRVLHLATHGFFLNSACAPAPSGTRGVGGLAKAAPAAAQNPLLLSGLALAGANRRAQARADEDDGILTAEEVSMLDLQGVEWAVLSACDTGVGEIKAGEGVFGLRRAFQVAGARTVIMSLWSVDDQATRAWMRALYEGRFQRQLSTADAVHQASLTALRDRRARGQSTHPFFWAAFVAAGDWR